jgi:multicomponent Na+:H+ antiporter subunit E
MKPAHLLSLLILNALFWLTLSMLFKSYLLVLGVLSLALTTWLAYRMRIIDGEGQPTTYLWRAPMYWAWLVWQVIRSNVAVCVCILRGQRSIDPQMVTVSADERLSKVAHTTLGNSITLTPGTVTVEIDDQSLLVHALSRDSAAELKSGVLQAHVRQLEPDA